MAIVATFTAFSIPWGVSFQVSFNLWKRKRNPLEPDRGYTVASNSEAMHTMWPGGLLWSYIQLLQISLRALLRNRLSTSQEDSLLTVFPFPSFLPIKEYNEYRFDSQSLLS